MYRRDWKDLLLPRWRRSFNDAAATPIDEEVKITIDDAVRAATARVIRGAKLARPDWMVERLSAIGQRSINKHR